MGLHKRKPRVSGAFYPDEIGGFLATKDGISTSMPIDPPNFRRNNLMAAC